MPVKIFRAARDRLVEIWNYTEETWGEEQADNYVRSLVNAATTLADRPYRWRPVADRELPGIFFFRHKHHCIFFRELEAGSVGVISILHEKMDLPSRLTEDARRGEEE